MDTRELIGIKASPRLMEALDTERLALRVLRCAMQRAIGSPTPTLRVGRQPR
jgi:hypothetical protein